MSTFEVGKKYMMRSICDYDCIWIYTIAARTKSMVTLMDENGKEKKCRVSFFMGEESCKPLGSYSMCPVLRSGNEVK